MIHIPDSTDRSGLPFGGSTIPRVLARVLPPVSGTCRRLCLTALALVAVLISAAAGGCNGNKASLEDTARLTRIQELEDQLAEKVRLLARKEGQLREQAKIVQQLRKLDGDRGLDALIHVDHIEIERLSGGFDDNGDGIDEGIRVHLRLFDQHGETMRATGSVQVKLLDLAAPSGQRDLGQIELTPPQLNALWFGRFLTKHYTVKVFWPAGVSSPRHERITVVVVFTDLLSGRSFDAQRVVEVSPVP